MSTPDGRDGIRIRNLQIGDYREMIIASWRANPRPSKTYNTDHGRERGRKSFDVDVPAKGNLVELVREQVGELACEYNYEKPFSP